MPEPVDERAALIELERFRQEIERYRIQRQTIGREFERFVEEFPAPEEVFPTEIPPPQQAAPPLLPPQPKEAAPLPLPPQPKEPAPLPLPPVPKRVPVEAAPRVDPSVAKAEPPAPDRAVTPLAAAAPPPTSPEPFEFVPASAVQTEPRRAGAVITSTAVPTRNRRIGVAIVVAVLAAVGAFATWSFRQASPQPAGQAPARVEAPPASATPPAAASGPPPVPLTESEITTLRPAWVRVIADGERVVERELAADTRISFKAEKTILIRTGDAGAVKLSIRGEDKGTLGRDGAVVTRSFEVR